MTEPRWISRAALLILHEEDLAEHGGRPGIRDDGLLDSALARPMNLFAYSGIDDPIRLAACYAFGIAKNHPFADGNKRAAFLSIGLFLHANGYRLVADRFDAYRVITALAAGDVGEDELALWLRENTRPR